MNWSFGEQNSPWDAVQTQELDLEVAAISAFWNQFNQIIPSLGPIWPAFTYPLQLAFGPESWAWKVSLWEFYFPKDQFLIDESINDHVRIQSIFASFFHDILNTRRVQRGLWLALGHSCFLTFCLNLVFLSPIMAHIPPSSNHICILMNRTGVETCWVSNKFKII